jgi:uncharacterized protein YqgC (DUF456 family)
LKELKKKIISIGTLSAGILLTLVGLAGLVLPIIPGFVLILVGLWMIGRVYKHPLLERLLAYVKRQISNITKKDSERKTGKR